MRNAQDFQGKVAKSYPGLKKTSPDLWKYLESVQPYHKVYQWLGCLNRINNANKHGNLVPQTRKETDQVRVTSSAGSVTWSPGNVKFGSGVAICGVPVDPRTQMPVPHPSQKVERITWVDFRFEGENVSALQLLKQAVEGVAKIVGDVEKWL